MKLRKKVPIFIWKAYLRVVFGLYYHLTSFIIKAFGPLEGGKPKHFLWEACALKCPVFNDTAMMSLMMSFSYDVTATSMDT